MNINGIIAEYNPFQNGHSYHLNTAIKQTDADYTIIAMSGNFMQRGAPAIIDKHKRARMALENGADLVLELPICYAASSAEFFATGAIALFDKLGVVSNLCFGSECGDLTILKEIAEVLLKEPEEYKEALHLFLHQGFSYPTARTRALLQYKPTLCKYEKLLSSPNNILGIEYIKALQKRNSTITPVTILRVGADYHHKDLEACTSSALAIREALFSGQELSVLSSQLPKSSFQILKEAFLQDPLICSNDFSSILHYKLLMEAKQGFTQYLDVTSDLSDRIRKNLYQYKSYQSFCELLKSKDMTYTRISRCMLHILLDIQKSHMELYREMDYIPYARVLGFRKSAAPLLKAIKKSASIPLVTKLADAVNHLTPQAYNMLQQELTKNSIYESIRAQKSDTPMRNELQIPLEILE